MSSDELLIEEYLKKGASLAISISGGKDGQAMANYLHTRFYAYKPQIFLIHADLGRAEWPQTPKHVEWTARRLELDLYIVRRRQGDLVSRIEDRKSKTQFFWPSSKQRYCTSDNKRNPINKYLRKFDLVISAEGIRAEESPARAKKPRLQVRRAISSTVYHGMSPEEALSNFQQGRRLALTWFPIFDWSLEEVWASWGYSCKHLEERRSIYKGGLKDVALDGWVFHPAYVIGNNRLSCAICILACDEDIRNGAEANPELADIYLKWEEETGVSFKNGKTLKQILNENPD